MSLEIQQPIKDVLLRMLINRVSPSQLNEVKALALDYLIDPQLHQDKLGTKLIRIKEFYFNKIDELYKEKETNPHLMDMDVEATFKAYDSSKNYNARIEYPVEYTLVNVDIFRKDIFGFEDLETGNSLTLDYFEQRKIEVTRPYIKIKKVEPISEEIPSSLNLDNLEL